MNIQRAYDTLCFIAKQHGVTVEEVMADIDEAIEEAINTAKRNHDRKTLQAWSRIPCKGSKPTALEVVAALGELTATGGSLFG